MKYVLKNVSKSIVDNQVEILKHAVLAKLTNNNICCISYSNTLELASNEIWYKTLTGRQIGYYASEKGWIDTDYIGMLGILLYYEDEEMYNHFGPNVISEEMNSEGYWVIKFAEDVTTVGLYYEAETGEEELYNGYWIPFTDLIDLTEIKLPNSLVSIKNDSFSWCSSLSVINIPNGVTEICAAAFLSCSALETITLPSTLTHIGIYSFSECYELTNINYEGTMELWNNITLDEMWNQDCGATVIHCADGDIEL